MVILLTVAALFAVFVLAVSNTVRIKEIEIESRKLPREFDGAEIAFLSDTHDAKFGEKTLKKVLKISPDWIFLGGDMHERPEKDEEYFKFLDGLSAIAPVYYVEGNHDARMKDRDDYLKYLANFEKRVTVLGGKTRLLKNGDFIDLYGCGYYDFDKEEFVFDKDRFSVFLYHSPFAFDELSVPCDLMISGHVHGGVLELPFVGAIFSPADGKPLIERFKREYLFPKYYKNTYKKDGGTLVVGRGLGNFKRCPLRLIPPEIVKITLRKV